MSEDTTLSKKQTQNGLLILKVLFVVIDKVMRAGRPFRCPASSANFLPLITL